MRLRSRVWILLAVACGGVTVCEIPNGRLLWRYALSAQNSIAARGKGNISPAVSDGLIAADPEAGDILKYCLGDPNGQDLGDLVTRYPQNEFFLAQLAERLLEANCVDRQAALILADKLTAISPENAHYRYLKGWILLKPPRDAGWEQEALEQFELGNRLPQFYRPYSPYKQRVEHLRDKANVSLLYWHSVCPAETNTYIELAKFLSPSKDPYATLSPESFPNLSAAISAVGQRLVDSGQTCAELEDGMVLLRCIETRRLKELSLSPEQAWQSRLLLGQAIAINNMLEPWFGELFRMSMDLAKIGLASMVPLIFVVQLPLLWLFLIIVNLLRGRAEPAAVGIKAYVLFILGLVGLRCLFALAAFLDELLPGSSLVSIGFVGGPMMVGGLLWLLAHLHALDHSPFKRSRRRAAVVCGFFWALGIAVPTVDAIRNGPPYGLRDWLGLASVVLGWSVLWTILWGVATYRQHVFRAVPYDRILRTRSMQMILLLLAATGIIRLVWTVPVAPAVLASVTLLLVGTIAIHPTEHRLAFLHALRQFFARKGQIVITRTKLAHMISVILLACWLVVLVGVHLSAETWRRMETMLTDPLALYGPLPQGTPETYERVILTNQPAEDHRSWSDIDSDIPEHMHLAAPADVTALLAKRQAEGKPLDDGELLRLAAKGGRDIRPIILENLTNPDDLPALMRRTEWGDTGVEKELVAIFEKKIAELGEPYARILQDPNCLQGLIMRARWGHDDARMELERRFAARMTRLVNAPSGMEDRDRLRSELEELVTINEILNSAGAHGHMGQIMRKNRERSDLLQQMLADADMLDLEPPAEPPEITPEHLRSLFDIVGALASISEPQETRARFQWLITLLLEQRRQSRDPHRQRSSQSFLREGDASWLFYRALRGVPRSEAGILLREYVQKSQLSDPFEEAEFLDVFARAGERAMAEWVLQKVAESPPSKELLDVPVGQIISTSDEIRTYRQDTSHEYLKAAFAHLTAESIPLLLEHIDSDNEQLRAFVVWRLTSLGYYWPPERARALLADHNWKVRLNALFASGHEELKTMTSDEDSVVRAIAQTLSPMGQ